MKKIKLFISALFLVAFINAQEGPFLGIHYSYNANMLMNNHVFDQGSEMDVMLAFGNFYGVMMGYNINDQMGIELNINMNTINQKYEGSLPYALGDNNNSYESNIAFTSLDIPLLLRVGYDTYLEFGPVLQVLTAAEYTRTFNNPTNLPLNTFNNNLFIPTNKDREDVLSDFSNTNIAFAFGFGTHVDIIQYKLRLKAGLRFQYTITDMEGIDGLGNTKDTNYVDNKDRFHNNSLIGGFKLGLVYYIF